MPEQETLERARQDKEEGKSPSTQAGEFVREEIHHVREGKHGARSTKQAIAIGLSKARRAGVKLPRKKGAASKKSRRRSTTSARRREEGRAHSGQARTVNPARISPERRLRAAAMLFRHQSHRPLPDRLPGRRRGSTAGAFPHPQKVTVASFEQVLVPAAQTVYV